MTQENFYELLAKTIREQRKKMKLSQLEFSKLAGVGKTVIFDIEHKKPTIKLSTLLKILKVLNIKVELKKTFN